MLDVIVAAERNTYARSSNIQQQREESNRATEQTKPQEKSCSWMWYLGTGVVLIAIIVGVSLTFYGGKDGRATTSEPADSSHHHTVHQNLSSSHDTAEGKMYNSIISICSVSIYNNSCRVY